MCPWSRSSSSRWDEKQTKVQAGVITEEILAADPDPASAVVVFDDLARRHASSRPGDNGA
jgi:hypothetical protein